MIATPKYFYHSDADVRIEMIQKFLQEELRVLIRIWYPDIFICKMVNGKNTDSPK